MELPDLGKHCSVVTCNKLDFLPIKCDACNKIFCGEHYQYTIHSCSNAYKINNQVPVCPLCNIPIPIQRGQAPDIAVGAHIDNDCQSDPAKNNRKAFINRCSFKGCKIKEVVPILCSECTLNYCLKHRHRMDHNCEGKLAAIRKRNYQAAMSRQNQITTPQNRVHTTQVQGTMLFTNSSNYKLPLSHAYIFESSNNSPSQNIALAGMECRHTEDEALAKALALSMQETNGCDNNLTQEELDLALARQLQASESGASMNNIRNSTNRCNVS